MFTTQYVLPCQASSKCKSEKDMSQTILNEVLCDFPQPLREFGDSTSIMPWMPPKYFQLHWPFYHLILKEYLSKPPPKENNTPYTFPIYYYNFCESEVLLSPFKGFNKTCNIHVSYLQLVQSSAVSQFRKNEGNFHQKQVNLVVCRLHESNQ